MYKGPKRRRLKRQAMASNIKCHRKKLKQIDIGSFISKKACMHFSEHKISFSISYNAVLLIRLNVVLYYPHFINKRKLKVFFLILYLIT